MSTTSFKKDKENAQGGAGSPSTLSSVAAVADRGPDNYQPATVNSEIPPVGGVSGDYQESDFRLPRINVVQAVGPLSEDFEPGTVVLNKDIVLLPAASDPKVWGDPLHVTVLNAKKQFQENVEYGNDDMPETVDTLEEVTARGGWIDWRGEEKPPWRPMLTALLLIEAPNELLADEFSIQGSDGKAYELALWTMKGTSYSRAGKAINTAARFALRNKETGLPELHKGKWTLQVRREKLGTNLVFVPRLRQHGKHSDEFIAFVTTLL
jgi:hypothetical protein